MTRFLTAAATALLIATTFVSLTATAAAAEGELAPPEPDGMKTIFNGRDLTGWDGDPRLWSVRDGVIRGETTARTRAQGNTFLICQEGELKDFELRLSFRVSSVNNSGIQYRSTHLPPRGANKWVVGGYQHEIRNSDTFPHVPGFIYEERGKRGRMCLVGEKAVWDEQGKKKVVDTLIDQPGFKELFDVDEWNDVVIIARGPVLKHYMNGRLILHCTDNHPQLARREGVIALQLHAGAPMWAEFKDIRLKDMGNAE
jgi:hypothetical protein